MNCGLSLSLSLSQAVNEEESLKQSIFEDIGKICPAHCIFASGTSGIDLNIIGKNTSSQDRIVGAHFFRLLHIIFPSHFFFFFFFE